MLEYHHKTVNLVDDEGLSHLHIACTFGRKNLIERLVSTETDVNNVYKGNSMQFITGKSTALHSAVRYGKYDAVPLLLILGADFYATDVNNTTPLHLLLSFKHKNPVHDLLIANFNLLRDFHGRTGLSLLHIASHSYNALEAKELLDLGENPNQEFIYAQNIDADDVNVNTFGYEIQSSFADLASLRPLHFAAQIYRPELVDVLVSRGADLFLKTPKCYPDFSKNYADCLKYILSVKTSPATLERLRKDLYVTPLHVACRNIDVNVVRGLLKEAVDVNAQIHCSSPIWPGFTPTHVLLDRESKESIDDSSHRNISIILELLIEKGASVTVMNAEQSSPLHAAYSLSYRSEFDQSRASKLLRSQNNFDVNPVNVMGISHFYIACALSDADIVEKFLQHGVDVNEKSDIFSGNYPSPLHASVAERSIGNKLLPLSSQVVELLLKYGADVTTVDSSGNSPLHVVVRDCSRLNNFRESLVEKLMSYGSDVNAMNIHGESAFEVILKNSCSEKEFELSIKHINYLNTFNPISNEGTLGLIFTNCQSESVKMTFDIIEKTPQIAKTDVMGRTAIHNVISSSIRVIFREHLFLKLAKIIGCGINDQDKKGKTALHYASTVEYTELVPSLLVTGANANIVDASGNNALHIAVLHNNKKVISALLKVEFYANYVNAEGNSALHIAVKHAKLDALSILLLGGVELDVVDTDGRTAVDISIQLEKDERELLSHKMDKNSGGLVRKSSCSQYNLESLAFRAKDLFDVHISKLKYSGFDLSELKIDLESYDVNCSLSDPEVFKQQLEKTKDVKIEPYSLSLYDYFSRIEKITDDPSRSLLRCRALYEFFKSNQNQEFQENFSEVIPVINTLHRKVLKILQIKSSLDRITKLLLPDLCLEAITKYFDKTSLENLIAATIDL